MTLTTDSDDNLHYVLTTLGREFSSLAMEVGIEACGQEAYEVFSEGLGADPTVSRLRSATEDDISRIRQECETFFESNEITNEIVKKTIERTLWHWS